MTVLEKIAQFLGRSAPAAKDTETDPPVGDVAEPDTEETEATSEAAEPGAAPEATAPPATGDVAGGEAGTRSDA